MDKVYVALLVLLAMAVSNLILFSIIKALGGQPL